MDTTRDNTEVDGHWMHGLMRELYPMFRALTGEGNRQTLAALAKHVPVRTHEVPTGAQAFDWTVPQEWRFRDAYVKDRTGRRVIDAQRLNLHVVSHSQPVRQTMTWEQLRPHLHTLPAQPSVVPYRHSFHRKSWGFCLSHEALRAIEREAQGPYEVCIDADFIDGSFTYGEVVLPGATDDEVLVSTHLCHPSLCNDNLSGVVVAAALAKRLAGRSHRHTLRFVFVPATLGPIVYLSQNPQRLQRVKHGLVLTGLGDPGLLTYKRSRRGDAPVDRVTESVVTSRGGRVIPFSPWGYDERQYGSPGFNLPMGTLMRSEPGSYPQYHTSADDLDYVTAGALADSLNACEQIMAALDAKRPATPPSRRLPRGAFYVNLSPYGEPQLGRRGIFDALSTWPDAHAGHMAVLWVLNLSDGGHGLTDIAERSALPLDLIERAAELLIKKDLLAPAERKAPVRAVAEAVV